MHGQQNIKFYSNSLTYKHISGVISLPICTCNLHEKKKNTFIHLIAFSKYHLEYFGKYQSKSRLTVKCTICHGSCFLKVNQLGPNQTH